MNFNPEMFMVMNVVGNSLQLFRIRLNTTGHFGRSVEHYLNSE